MAKSEGVMFDWGVYFKRSFKPRPLVILGILLMITMLEADCDLTYTQGN
jgi:hypothetical protein